MEYAANLIIVIEYTVYLRDRGQEVRRVLHGKEERKRGREEEEEQPTTHPLSCDGVHFVLLILNLASGPPPPLRG